MEQSGKSPIKYYKLDGREIVPCKDVYEWGAYFEKADRNIGSTEVGKLWVSTVFLGIDHLLGLTHDGPPHLFETMVFPRDSMSEEYCERCSTWEEAEEQHRVAVEWARNHQPKEEKDD